MAGRANNDHPDAAHAVQEQVVVAIRPVNQDPSPADAEERLRTVVYRRLLALA
jgi:hypothetical protein